MSLRTIIANSTVVSCDRSARVEEIASLMDEHDIGAVVVEENEQAIGMITDRDLVLRCLAQGSEGLSLTAEDIMSSPVETVHEDEGIYNLIEQMHDKRIRRVCVTDEKGKCLAIVSLGDILELLSKEIGKVVEASTPQPGKFSEEAKSA